MARPECTRAWQAEAALDGRLSDADEQSFHRHVLTCAICDSEVKALSALQETASRLPALTSTPLERRRLRNETLRRANELAIGPPRRSFGWVFVVAASVFFVFVASTLLRGGPPQPLVPTYRITASPGAEWRTVERTLTLRLLLQRGRFELEVDKLHTGQRFLLALPDGELEVKGTHFVVETDGAHTLAVRVEEGVVAVRIPARTARDLVAGESWQAVQTPPAPAPSVSVATPVAGIAKEPSLPPPRREGTKTHDFSDAMAAFSAGDYGRAERLFEDFERKNPSDGRVEDSTFLRAVARSRRGDSNGARAVASDYLRRYPHGLRRADAERFANP